MVILYSKLEGNTSSPSNRRARKDKQMDGQTDGSYQVHYINLPAVDKNVSRFLGIDTCNYLIIILWGINGTGTLCALFWFRSEVTVVHSIKKVAISHLGHIHWYQQFILYISDKSTDNPSASHRNFLVVGYFFSTLFFHLSTVTHFVSWHFPDHPPFFGIEIGQFWENWWHL